MSFREIGKRPSRAVNRVTSLPRVRVTDLAETSPAKSRSKSKNNPRRQRSMVLHGRIHHDDQHELQSRCSEDTSVASIRDQLQRKSDFAKLASNAKHFQKLVADLESVLRQSGDSPEAAWRSRILIKSAQETSDTLWKNLYTYETSLKQRKHQPDVRTAQTACVKLHRDVKRTQKTLVMCLSRHERQQQAEVSMLGAVGWTGDGQPETVATAAAATTSGTTRATVTATDLFDRKMRERELERINTSMHQVHDLYQELAGMVHEQQEPIDTLEETIVAARENVDAGAQQLKGCGGEESMFCGAGGGWTEDDRRNQGFDSSISFSDDKPLDAGCSGTWYVAPLASMNYGIEAVKGFHKDLVDVGKDILGKQQEEGGKSTRNHPPALSISSSSSTPT